LLIDKRMLASGIVIIAVGFSITFYLTETSPIGSANMTEEEKLDLIIEERENYKILHASRKRRIASGSGTTIQEVNKLLKQYHTMLKMMKKYGKMDKKLLMRQGFGNIIPPGLH